MTNVLPSQVVRHPLGLPAGSVRALLALMVFGLFWTMLLLPEDKEIRIPLYLYYLMFLVLGSYFATRGRAITPPGVKAPQPLHLPRGTLRFLTIAGFAAALGWGFYRNPDLVHRLDPTAGGLDAGVLPQPYLPLVLLIAFFLGIIVNRLAQAVLADSHGGLPAWYQDLFAWISLLAMLGLGVEIILRLVIYPSVSPERQFDLPHWEGFLAAVVSFYFGARSGS
jgi:hypothetical protein